MSSLKVSLLGLGAYLAMDSDMWKAPSPEKPKKRKHRCWSREWSRQKLEAQYNPDYENQLEYIILKDEHEFRAKLRMDEETYAMLLYMIRPKIEKQNTTFRQAVSVQTRLTVTLNYLAFGGTNSTLSRRYRIGKSTCGTIIKATCQALYDVLKDQCLTTPNQPDQWREISDLFQLRWQFPNCIGALEGKRVRFQPPSSRGIYSIFFIMLVDANYRIIYVDVGDEEKIANGRFWHDCSLKMAVDTDSVGIPQIKPWPNEKSPKQFVFLGNDAFPLGSNLLKPYSKDDLTKQEQVFNYRLNRARRVAENAFGIIASRFQLLLRPIGRSSDSVMTICLAVAALHNLLSEQCGINYLPDTAVDQEGSSYELIPGEWRNEVQVEPLQPTEEDNPSVMACDNRDALAAYFMTEAGEVPWQNSMIEH